VVALKLLTLASERAVERFRGEVRLARKVTHRNVARIHDLGQAGDIRFLTMEYVEGRGLDDLLDEEGPLSPERAARIARDIVAGLAAAHEAGVIHRDLKPANVMVASDGRAVITDFGIARAMASDAKTHETGMLIGTPHYMSPEQVSGRKADTRSDIYAFGLIVFEMLTGRLPFEGDTPIAVATARLHQEPIDPREIGTVPDALATLVLACTRRDPEHRPSSKDVTAALDAYLGGDRKTPSSLSQSLFAPIAAAGEQTIAVLPFSYRGSRDHDYLGDGLAEELIDVLSRTRGLKVLAMGATRRFAEARDPAVIGEELGADSVVDGTVQLAGSRVRITARLIEPGSGVQRWNDRFDGSVEDIFELQESMGRRIAEALRVEVDAASHAQTAPREAVELYLRARRLLRRDVMLRAEEALELLDQCLELAPEFSPGLAAHAVGAVRAWWGTSIGRGEEREQRARESVELARSRAPDLAETHLAAAMFDGQFGRYRESAIALGRALEIAPTMAEAQHYLGDLQIESGRVAEGLKRLALTLELDPTLQICHLTMARVAVYSGDEEGYRHHMEAVEKSELGGSLPVTVGGFRKALWLGEVDEAKAKLAKLRSFGTGAAEGLALLCGFAVGESEREVARGVIQSVPGWLANPRFNALMYQIGTEVFSAAGDLDTAAETIALAADGALLDITWMDGCPILETLRADPRWAEAHAEVAARAANVWRR
jgi:serine/threonine-protein kinase